MFLSHISMVILKVSFDVLIIDLLSYMLNLPINKFIS